MSSAGMWLNSTKTLVFFGALFISLAANAAMADSVSESEQCSDILQYGVFENYESTDIRYLLMEEKHLYCASDSGNKDSNISGEASAVIKLIPASASAQDRNSEAWKREVCKQDWSKLIDWKIAEVSIRAASKTIVDAWRNCMDHKKGVTAGILFSTPYDFILQVKITGLSSIPSIKYLNTGIRFSPHEAAIIENFAKVSTQQSREHIFTGHRKTSEGFSIIVDSKPEQVVLKVPSRSFVGQKKSNAPIRERTALADLTPSRIVGIYTPRSCYGNPSIIIANGKTYPDSVVFPPDLNNSTVVEWEVPRGAQTLIFDGAAFCHEPSTIRGCYDSNNGFAHVYVYVSIDGVQVYKAELSGRHDLPNSYSVKGGPFSFLVKGHHVVRLETVAPDTRWCAHSTILNPYFLP